MKDGIELGKKDTGKKEVKERVRILHAPRTNSGSTWVARGAKPWIMNRRCVEIASPNRTIFGRTSIKGTRRGQKLNFRRWEESSWLDYERWAEPLRSTSAFLPSSSYLDSARFIPQCHHFLISFTTVLVSSWNKRARFFGSAITYKIKIQSINLAQISATF